MTTLSTYTRILAIAVLTAGLFSIPPIALPHAVQAQEAEEETQRPRMVRRQVDWGALRERLREGRLQRLAAPRSARQADLQECRVPILLPYLRRLRQNVSLYPKKDFYTAFISTDTHTIEIIGTRISRDLPDDSAMARTMRSQLAGRSADDILVTKTDYGADASFTRFGVAYTISVICSGGSDQADCASEAYVREIAENLAFAGGTPDNGEAVTEGTFVAEDQ